MLTHLFLKQHMTLKFQLKIKEILKQLSNFSGYSKNLDLTPEAFERERKIVEEEYRTDIGNDKRYVDEIHKYIYKNSRLLKRKPIGTLEVIQNFKYEDAISYYKKWYQPERMGLFIVGQIEPEEIKGLINQYFGEFKNSEETIVPDYKIPNFEKNQFFTYQDPLEESVRISIWEKDDFKKINTFKNYRQAIISYLVDDIYQRRMDEIKELNQAGFTNSYVFDYRINDLDMYYVSSTYLKQNKVSSGIEDILTIIEQIKRYGFLPSELTLAKRED